MNSDNELDSGSEDEDERPLVLIAGDQKQSDEVEDNLADNREQQLDAVLQRAPVVEGEAAEGLMDQG